MKEQRGLFIIRFDEDQQKAAMITVLRTDSDNPDFIELVRHLDAELAERDGNDHVFYAQFNRIDRIKHVVIAYENNRPVGCGAIREYAPTIMEVKRMYTLPAGRDRGIATQVLLELEAWARELAFEKCVLETGKKQPEAISLYEKNGYKVIPNYGPYVGVDNSVCYAKNLIK